MSHSNKTACSKNISAEMDMGCVNHGWDGLGWMQHLVCWVGFGCEKLTYVHLWFINTCNK